MAQEDRPTNYTLVSLLAELGSVHLLFQRETESLLAVAVFSFQDRQLLTVERTYRDGTHVIVDPTPEEIEIARSGELWDLWNSKRARLLMGMV
ncbi:MAG TPA: hypothetical protein VFE33_28085 [Thermoanaerobaculia bacterium]|nr:hypothetical protein [Thermoanaerobaculia bacterium]